MSYARRLLLFVAHWAALCLSLLSAPALAGTVVDRVVAVVNDEVILLSEVDQMAAPTYREAADLSTLEGRRKFDAHRRKVLDSLIEKQLIAQKAKEMKIQVTLDEVRRAVEEVKKNNGLDDAQFREALRQQGFSIDSYQKQLRQQLLELKVINQEVRSRVSVADEEVRAHYAQSVRQAAGDESQVHLRQIFLALPKGADQATVEARSKVALALVEQARAGADFAGLARKQGEDPLSRAGGDLGWIARGDLPDQLREVVASMEVGDVRGPVRSDRGLHVIQLVEKKEGGAKSYEEMKEQLRQQLYQQQVEKGISNWTKELRRKAHVDVRF
jgi:parvulin-like peptidyl-prolyl isomerase